MAHLCPQLEVEEQQDSDSSSDDENDIETALRKVGLSNYKLKPEEKLDPENVCIDAFRGAISCIAAAMCQGPTTFTLTTWLKLSLMTLSKPRACTHA